MTALKRPAADGTADAGRDATERYKHSATPRKWQRVLRAFVDGRSFNRFDAYRELRDSCLNTTVSQIEGRGVRILRHEETVPGAFGPVHCCRYRIAPESLQRARELLASRDIAGTASERSHAALTPATGAQNRFRRAG